MLRVDRLSESDFLRMENEWNALLEASCSNGFFLTWEWLSEWWRYFGKGKELLILALYDLNGLCGIAPLFLEKKYYFKHFPVLRIAFLGTDMVDSDYLDLIIRSGCEEEAIQCVVNYLFEAPFNWDLMDLTDITEDSPTIHYFRKYTSESKSAIVFESGEICPFLALPHSSIEYRSGLSKNDRYNISRRSKNLYKHFGENNVLLNESNSKENPEALSSLISELFSLHRIRWGSVRKKTLFSLPQVERFHRALLPGLIKKRAVIVFSLSVEEQVVAIIYGFVYGGKYYFYQSGFDPAFSQYSPGLVLMNYSIEQAIHEGLSEYDFLRGEEDYKSKFTKTCRRTYHVEIWKNMDKKRYLRFMKRAYSVLKAGREKILKIS